MLEYQNLKIEMMENTQIIHQRKTKRYTFHRLGSRIIGVTTSILLMLRKC
nr:MAG TPA: hypothetical protein [Caudoviricetes sp.]